MEELLICRGWFAGKVQIIELPPSMRLLLINNFEIYQAYIDTQLLPLRLQQIVIRQKDDRDEKVIVYVDDVQSHDRVSDCAPLFTSYSAICRSFQKTTARYAKEFQSGVCAR